MDGHLRIQLPAILLFRGGLQEESLHTVGEIVTMLLLTIILGRGLKHLAFHTCGKVATLVLMLQLRVYTRVMLLGLLLALSKQTLYVGDRPNTLTFASLKNAKTNISSVTILVVA